MPRYRLLLEYDGGPYNGFQAQADQPSVQASLERAVKAFCGEDVRVAAAGRTDSGVHATGQVAHVDVEKEFTPDKLQAALNFHLKPWPVSIIHSEIASPDFHARFSATGRAYLYRIINRRPPLALEEGRAWLVNAPLDAATMHDAAQVLVGKHDFSTFRASLCQAQSPVKTLTRLSVSRAGEEIDIIAEARSFLHHQVRNMVGTLRLVGEGKWSRDDLRAALDARDRTKGGPTAPPQGLYLTGVKYDPLPES